MAGKGYSRDWANSQLGGTLDDLLDEWGAAGMTPQEIRDALYDREVVVSTMTVRRWLKADEPTSAA